jgi:Arc/MetJ-type ribon-helix-helix transcriptional regulator
MPTRNVNLTEELDRFVLEKVESGRYENASEVVRGATDPLAWGAAVRGEAYRAEDCHR